jgi:hypothetical protein
MKTPTKGLKCLGRKEISYLISYVVLFCATKPRFGIWPLLRPVTSLGSTRTCLTILHMMPINIGDHPLSLSHRSNPLTAINLATIILVN